MDKNNAVYRNCPSLVSGKTLRDEVNLKLIHASIISWVTHRDGVNFILIHASLISGLTLT